MKARTIGKQEGHGVDCPRCGSQELWRHGTNSAGNRQWLCRTCSRVFVVEPHIPKSIKTIADRLIFEQISVAAIAKILHGFVSRRWLYNRKRYLDV